MYAQLILVGVFFLAVASEVIIFATKDYLSGTRRTQSIETQLRQAHADIEEARKRLAEKRKRLTATQEVLERGRSVDEQLDKEEAVSRFVRPILIHPVGPVGSGTCYRAQLLRQQPSAEEIQQLIWSHDNYVEIWTENVTAGEEEVRRAYSQDGGYSVGSLTVFASRSAGAAS